MYKLMFKNMINSAKHGTLAFLITRYYSVGVCLTEYKCIYHIWYVKSSTPNY